MAEPFGIAAGSVSIAAAFSCCVECFGYVQMGRHFGREYQTNLLILDLLRLRLTRWGEAVDVFNDPLLGNPRATESEVQKAKDTLLHILLLFADCEKTSKQYRLVAKGEDLSSYSTAELDPSVLSLRNRMRELTIKRQKKASLVKLTAWALYRGEEFAKLVGNITNLVEALESLFPAPDRQRELVIQDMQGTATGAEDLEILEKVGSCVDRLTQAAAKEALQREHGSQVYKKVIVVGRGRAINGAVYAADWVSKESDILVSQSIPLRFDDIRVEDDARVVNGPKFGGKDFWD
jgi:hypothetical protein